MRTEGIRHIALLALLAALCLALQLGPRLPNVEFTSLFVFITGVFFGPVAGLGLGASVMFINGFVSHWGAAGLLLPFQIAGMTIIGVMGGAYGFTKKGVYTRSCVGEAAVLGSLLTLVYDLITNFGWGVNMALLGTPLLPALVAALISGVPLMVVHVGSNFLVFLVAFFPVTRALKDFFGGESIWRTSNTST